jgi:5-methylcytosine-specific restriction endonuclease McrA
MNAAVNLTMMEYVSNVLGVSGSMSEWHSSKEWIKARAYAKTILEPVCARCGKDLEGNDWTIDHMIASDPPNHDISNLQSMCRRCNGYKQDKVLERITWSSDRWQ